MHSLLRAPARWGASFATSVGGGGARGGKAKGKMSPRQRAIEEARNRLRTEAGSIPKSDRIRLPPDPKPATTLMKKDPPATPMTARQRSLAIAAAAMAAEARSTAAHNFPPPPPTTYGGSANAGGPVKMRLYHSPGARSLRCLWTINELGLQDRLELITLPFPPRVHNPEFLEQNILGTIPYFEDDDGVKMTESVAVCMYLAQKNPGSSLAVAPTESQYGEFLNWMFHADATLTFPQTVVLRYSRQEPGVADAAVGGEALTLACTVHLTCSPPPDWHFP